MTTLKPSYAASAALTITVASLGSGSARQSTAIDNTSNLYVDALVGVKLKANAAGTSSTGYCNVYLYGTWNDAADYSDGASGTDGAITINKNLRLVGVITLDANAETAKGGPYSVAQAFGSMPKKWGVVVENQSGAALDSTGGNHDVSYMGVQYISA